MDLHKLTAGYIRFKLLLVAVPRIVAGLVAVALAPVAAIIAIICFTSRDLFSLWNGAAIIAAAFAVYLAISGVEEVMSTLPTILKPRTSDAPGRSRLATRDDLRRSGII
jgi:hypothetical protein